jgi:DNA-binding NtrC family response regulator
MKTPARILVVDDEIVICKSCEKILRREGHEVVWTLSGKEGLARVRGEKFDVVFTDLKMADIGGMEILRTIREEHPEVAVIVITGYATVAAAVETMRLGAYDFLPKPFTPDELLGALKNALEKRSFQVEGRQLAEEPEILPDFCSIIGHSPRMREVFTLIDKVAPTDSTVLLVGESGTGKELAARAIHERGRRRAGRFVAVDCGVFSKELLASELFGHVKGAFTGAVANKLGLLQIANGGTVFLDEIGNIDLEIQVKMLRFLQEREVLPVGGTEARRVDARLIFATNRDLKRMVEEGEFRDDLYYRLLVFPIRLPSLRERREDIPALAYHFLKEAATRTGKPVRRFDAEALEQMVQYDWPGNVRQLENTIERLVILAEGDTIHAHHLSTCLHESGQIETTSTPADSQELKALKKEARERAVADLEKRFVVEALRRNDWNVTRAAREVRMQRTNFQALMRKYGLSRRAMEEEFGGDAK